MSTAIISVETILLLILLVLVAGLLRSHAEILRRLAAPPAPGTDARLAPAVTPERQHGTPAPAIAGPTPDGDAISLQLAASGGDPTLLAFLTTGCSTCAGFWETLGEPRLPAGVRTVVVTHGAERERPVALRRLAPDGIPVIMSSQAWGDYAVPGAPYFVLVDGTIRGEGAATSWSALGSLVSDAIEDARASQAAGPPRASNGTERAQTVDRTLAAGGIGPDHPSLYPGER
ncbi:MAG: hypothetical protein ABI355_18920 [Solirubrobacteraceae bacterium]